MKAELEKQRGVQAGSGSDSAVTSADKADATGSAFQHAASGRFPTGTPAPSAGSTAGTLSDAAAQLGRQLRENLNNDIVRQAKFVLKDSNRGEIHLTLRPESLGRVRFQLHLADNHIAGRIFVDNSSVKDTFEQNMQNLYQALRDGGFETASLEVSVGNGGDNGESADFADDRSSRNRVRSDSIDAIGRQIPVATEFGFKDNRVNLVV